MTNTNKILPNSFQTPNFFVDECMPLLTGNEYKCLSFVARKTFGWQKRSDRIAKSQIAAATGLGHVSVDKAMNSLMTFGLVVRVDNNARNLGNEWMLQIDSTLVRFDLLADRQAKQAETNHNRTVKARLKSQGGGAVPQTPPVPQGSPPPVGQGGTPPVRQAPQKPIKITNKNGGADAPVCPVQNTEDRISDFPQELQEGARLMQAVFNIKPPERPNTHEKGSDFALWVIGLRALLKVASEYGIPLEKAMQLTRRHWNERPFDVAHPGALKKTMTSVLAQYTSQATQKSGVQDIPQSQPVLTGASVALPNSSLQARMEALRARKKGELA